MGSFYTNIALRGPTQNQVVQYLKQQNNRAYVSPTTNGFTVVYDELCDTQDTDALDSLATTLSEKFDCVAIAFLNHDDSILWYRLYKGGQLIDEYDSTPGYFDGNVSEPSGGDASKLCELMASQNVEKANAILHKPTLSNGAYVMASERHMDLVQALGVPTLTVNLGFQYIEAGGVPDVSNFDKFKPTW